ncbi:serine/threonine-protein kinase [Streptomyces sp. SMS_SU21]|uniref:serine/threonine-protein kinase n=1 Tax=Streptomyces sp. SMS_SU21 TaxID=2069440 RepID=UPI000C886672|nr:serine/threonine-protein kinase [Streptomyces sp. SMS_SU21]MCA2203481.1 serine/threonine-protein kinase PknG [Streptomyces sp. SMS_SU21]NEA95263.1 tetratricopeptide repeat protein [Actinospica acidiphila]
MSEPGAQGPVAPAPARERSACQRPECDGAYDDVGGAELYCDTCGLAPVVSPTGLVVSPPTGITAGGRDSQGARSGSGGAGSGGAGSGRSSRTSSQSSRSRRSVSGRLSRSLSGRTAAGRSVSVRSSGAGGTSSGRGRLGAGLVQVPPIPRPDPRRMVLDDPEVPERKRFCSRSDCGAPVGRARNGRPGRTEGFCTKCGHPYSFVPKLRPGDVVHGQYEVVGCLAHGGLGWIYLAVDRAVADRWVVLKGLLDTGDQDAMAAAISERRFLAEIEHANIVRIYNFVEHLDQRTGSLDGYIVMEYVGGRSLKEIANARRTPEGRRDPLPVEQACAYGIEALEALGHLHSRNLLYCDFKVDNAIQTEDQLKLIDMGAVRRTDDDESAIYGTVGYQAPEVAEVGPSVASDLYTVARTLAVLTFDFQGYTNVYADSLPDPDTIEVFRQYESFYRLLVRATDPDPARRFASAQEMAEQLTGVLREVVSLQSGQARPALSTLFGPELRVTDTELFPPPDGDVSRLGARRTRTRKGVPVPAPALPPSAASLVRPVDCPTAALALPVPHVQPTDPDAGFLAGLLASAPGELIHALAAAPDPSTETRLRVVRARLETGGWATALEALDALEAEDPDDWRVVWYRGVAALVTGDHEGAALAFDAIYDAFPGEIAPKLALGLCAEVLGQLDNAAEYYRLVWSTDPSYVSAAFGLARVQLAAGDRHGAVRTLESVPESSIHYTAARVAAVRARLRGRTATAADAPFLDDLTAAAGQVEALESYGLDPARRELLAAEVLGRGLDWVLSGGQGSAPPAAGGRTLLGSGLDERGLRFGLERSYRTLARLARSGEERIDLVERANRYRPRTWV